MAKNQTSYYQQHPMPATWCAARRAEAQAWVDNPDAPTGPARTFVIELLAQLKQADAENTRLVEETHNWSAAVKKLEAERVARPTWLPPFPGPSSPWEGDTQILVPHAIVREGSVHPEVGYFCDVNDEWKNAQMVRIDDVIAWHPTPPAITCLSLRRSDTQATVRRVFEPIGTVHCINTARANERKQLRYFGKNAASTATGQAHETQAQAVADVVAWANGLEVVYEKHGLKRPKVAHG
ncbi:MAG TPA: hypothetical protein VF690_06865 [Hymenobacter sp.]|jgi:hypothetical protein